mmetsp:Transcript_2852/g.3329  ORF Transcript_2852/g.3329 Transcript_2852/m.3329 type:complete len:311 (-) Transcript_2852:82-1014(-)
MRSISSGEKGRSMNRTKQIYRRIIRVAAYVAIFQVISCVLLTTTAFAASRIQISTPVGREKFVSNTRQKQPKIYRRLSIKSNNLSKSLVQAHGSLKSEEVSTKQVDKNVIIREAVYSDLPNVADIIVKSFYEKSNGLFAMYNKVNELQRLQTNFPYDKSRHSMLVACHKDRKKQILGFVDIDGRPSKLKNAPPRPYLSDLVVDINWRRRGIACALISRCEDKVKSYGSNDLYLRVEFKNNAAISMYGKRGYDAMKHHYFGVKDTTLLLHKCFGHFTKESSSESTERIETKKSRIDASQSVVDSFNAGAFI